MFKGLVTACLISYEKTMVVFGIEEGNKTIGVGEVRDDQLSSPRLNREIRWANRTD